MKTVLGFIVAAALILAGDYFVDIPTMPELWECPGQGFDFCP